MSTRFFTNKNGNTLIRKFEGVLTSNPMVKNLDAVVGFLRSSGYFQLRPFLNNIDKVRILIGIDVVDIIFARGDSCICLSGHGKGDEVPFVV